MPWIPLTDDPPILSGNLAIHAALVPTKTGAGIFYFEGYAEAGARLFDVDNLSVSDKLDVPGFWIFCSGHAFLGDGRLIIGGGIVNQDVPHGVFKHDSGERRCYIYSPIAGKFETIHDFNFQPGSNFKGGGRWYPTLVTLLNGEVLAIGGHPYAGTETDDTGSDDYVFPGDTDRRHNNNTPERYSPTIDDWTLLTKESTSHDNHGIDEYPRVHVAPSGHVFFSTIAKDNKRFYDPYTGTYTGNDVALGDGAYYHGSSATSVLLPILPDDEKNIWVLVCGGTDAKRINIAADTPEWKGAGIRELENKPVRNHLCAVILPTGTIFITGGVGEPNDEYPQGTSTRIPEFYTPDIDWSTGKYGNGGGSWSAPTIEHPEQHAKVVRGYHSVALLMPDGRVWTAGSTDPAGGDKIPPFDRENEYRIEIYEPSYYNSNRPTIVKAPPSVGYGQKFNVTIGSDTISRVALTRCGSVTHAFDSDQRYVGMNFTKNGNELTLTSPRGPNIAPPGNYLLWVVGTNNHPCQRAKFIRICDQKSRMMHNHSTFSKLEVEALLEQGQPAVFEDAFRVVFENFLPHELAYLGDHPQIKLKFEPANGQQIGDRMTATLSTSTPFWWEMSPPPDDIAQTKTFVFDVSFRDKVAMADLYNFSSTERKVKISARFGHFSCTGEFTLTKTPNPFIIDLSQVYKNPEWLSIDLRVFKIHPTEQMLGIPDIIHEDSKDASISFIQKVLDKFDEIESLSPNSDAHPFNLITPEYMQNNQLEIAEKDMFKKQLTPVFNYAVAKVRYRALTKEATDVRVFFRLFITQETALQYNKDTTYYTFISGNKAVPLLGSQDGNVVSIPFYATKRVTPDKSMIAQEEDEPNKKPIPPHADGSESVRYFGCWLDFNQTDPHFPLRLSGEPPFLSIQEIMRNYHPCLVAEIFFKDDPTPPNATPALSDNLSQRNLVTVDTLNPGGPGSRIVQTTFEVKPSTGPKRILNLDNIMQYSSSAAISPIAFSRIAPDELAIIRNNLPVNTEVTLYLPDVDINEILTLAELRHAPPILQPIDDHTVRCRLGDVGYIPLPGGRTNNIAGLLSLEMPSGLTKGELYTLTVQQYSGYRNQLIGSFQLNIPVKSKDEILPNEIRKLSVLRHIAKAIPASDRWYPIFSRYLDQVAVRVREFGGDPDKVEPSADGSGISEKTLIPEVGYRGKISQILYDCFGDFEGFVLDLCLNERLFKSREKSIEEIVTKACRERISVTVYIHPDTKDRPYKIGLHCQ